METWLALPQERQAEILTRASEKLGVDAKIIEKDLWVTAVLKVLFEGPYQSALAFKGGTSLSKAWGLIERFSEDVDLSFYDPNILPREVSASTSLKRFKEAAREFFKAQFREDLKTSLNTLCVNDNMFQITVEETVNSDQDPTRIYVTYESAVTKPVIKALREDQVLLEVSGRSELHPAETRQITSMLAKGTNGNFGLGDFYVHAIHPSRTFLEKCFLLHEEFTRTNPRQGTKAERLSRHLYDITRLMEAPEIRYDAELVRLFGSIAKHRKLFSPIRGVAYDTLSLDTIVLTPPEQVLEDWRRDYSKTCQALIEGDAPPFEQLLASIQVLQQRFSALVG